MAKAFESLGLVILILGIIPTAVWQDPPELTMNRSINRERHLGPANSAEGQTKPWPQARRLSQEEHGGRGQASIEAVAHLAGRGLEALKGGGGMYTQ